MPVPAGGAGAPAGTNLVVTSDLAVPAQTRVSFDGVSRLTGSQLVSYTVERWHASVAYGGDRVDHTPRTGGTATSPSRRPDACASTTAPPPCRGFRAARGSALGWLSTTTPPCRIGRGQSRVRWGRSSR